MGEVPQVGTRFIELCPELRLKPPAKPAAVQPSPAGRVGLHMTPFGRAVECRARMKRRVPRTLLTAVTALSAALCVATVTLWARSYYWSDCVTRHRAVQRSGVARVEGVDWEDHVSVVSDGGRIGYVLRRVGAQGVHRHLYIDPARVASGLPYWTFQASETPPPGWLGWAREVEWAWFDIGDPTPQIGGLYEQDRDLRLPHWVLVLLLGFLPARRGWKVARNRHRAGCIERSLCPACGYDLRATPDRCPECGAVPSPPSA